MKTKTLILGAIFAMICVYGANALTEEECDVTPGMVWDGAACVNTDATNSTVLSKEECVKTTGNAWLPNTKKCLVCGSGKSFDSEVKTICDEYNGQTIKENAFLFVCANISQKDCQKIEQIYRGCEYNEDHTAKFESNKKGNFGWWASDEWLFKAEEDSGNYTRIYQVCRIEAFAEK